MVSAAEQPDERANEQNVGHAAGLYTELNAERGNEHVVEDVAELIAEQNAETAAEHAVEKVAGMIGSDLEVSLEMKKR